MKKEFGIEVGKCPPEVKGCLDEVLFDLGLSNSEGSLITLDIEEGDALTVRVKDNKAYITYTRKNEIFRAVSLIEKCLTDGVEIKERAKYSELTYMMDASRNAVPNLTDLKSFIRLLATIGYDSLMLYTEDTFELPGHPYFGHMRGRYTKKELIEIDNYSASFGIELIHKSGKRRNEIK